LGRIDWHRETSKRFLDICLVILSIPFWVPTVLLLGLLVKLKDGGPLLYRRKVVGRGGEFHVSKLRTMRVDAELWIAEHRGLLPKYQESFKLKNDPRITRLGQILRKYSLDELPQLFNVLKGQMSLVGPRMVSPPELEKCRPRQAILLTVRPGITGYCPVSDRQEVSYEERVKMDVY